MWFPSQYENHCSQKAHWRSVGWARTGRLYRETTYSIEVSSSGWFNNDSLLLFGVPEQWTDIQFVCSFSFLFSRLFFSCLLSCSIGQGAQQRQTRETKRWHECNGRCGFLLFIEIEEASFFASVLSARQFSWVIFVVPFCANLFSAFFIVFNKARQRVAIWTRHSYERQLRKQFIEHRQVLVSPIVLVILSFPRYLGSSLSGCVKASWNPWLLHLFHSIDIVHVSIQWVHQQLATTIRWHMMPFPRHDMKNGFRTIDWSRWYEGWI